MPNFNKGHRGESRKIMALVEMQDPISVKDVQKLTGRVAALNRFIPRAAERSFHSFTFSEVPRISSGPKPKSKLSKN
jgi:phage FluMu protein gp41